MTNSRAYEFSPGDILVVGTDKRIHKAKLIKLKRITDQNNCTVSRREYLYLAYRDGKTVRQKYLGKLA